MSANIWVNGIFQDKVSAFDRGLAYGDGLFATMRSSKNGVLFFDAHLRRLQQSCRRLGVVWQPSEELRQLIEKVGTEGAVASQRDVCVKFLLSRGVGGRGYQAPESAQLTEVVSVHAIPAHYADWQSSGINLQTSEMTLAFQPRLAGIKHLNRLEQVLIRAQALDDDSDDWLVLDTQGNVIESSMANLFLIKGKQVVTPSLQGSGVAGVMREQLIYWFIDAGFHVDCRPVLYDELKDHAQFDHALLSNSLFGVVGIKRIDKRMLSASELPQGILNDLALVL
ncbi:aminodeoxychorismate lyase [Shewanella sp. AS1]|uniref:aminodeoxychorismate lyase n=1 Tax=Shewanella sp. AS1 TaxID=2907626 RepID=UPI001F3435C3|nr:aminodeoxychorismate lyase [Shewanella sp. AS1]MCE9678342.1 aminodeoxychorismate lyase [Shewanella sp. AS1]